MEEKPSLQVHEWLVVIVLITVIAVLAAITSFVNNKVPETLAHYSVQTRSFEVVVCGSVKNPGCYHFHSPVTLKDVLAIAEVDGEADLRRYDMDQLISRGKNIDVPPMKKITVTVTGAVKNPGSVKLLSGSTLEDLIPLIAFDEDANIKPLQKKRKLKEGEVVNVPLQRARTPKE